MMAKGTIAQCKPNITKICHVKPNTSPKIIGLNPCKARSPFPKASEAMFMTGPIMRKPKGIAIKAVKKGARKSFTTSGIIFLSCCSRKAAKAVIAIIGITDEP